jgi:hypothetical protein
MQAYYDARQQPVTMRARITIAKHGKNDRKECVDGGRNDA